MEPEGIRTLVLDDVTVHYGRIAALRGVSLQVHAGELVSVVGPNGAGKSTLLLTIAGALAPTAGRLVFEGRSIARKGPESIVRSGISLVPERRRIFNRLTVEENLLLGGTPRSDRATARLDMARLLERFPILGQRLHSPASTLSGGEQQQLALARSLLTRPRLLLVDEPSLGLAPKLVDLIFRVLTELQTEGVTILLVEQNALRAVEMANRAYILRGGHIELTGTPEQLLRKVDFQRLYLGSRPESHPQRAD